MFTLNQIQEAHKKVKSGVDFPKYVQDLKHLGVTHYDNFVKNGKAIFYGANNFNIESDPKYPLLEVNTIGSESKLEHALSIHQQGETDYLTFCKQAADAGVEKWVTHMIDMTVTYLDKENNILIIETIPDMM